MNNIEISKQELNATTEAEIMNVVNFLYEEWQREKSLEVLLRLGFLCWHTRDDQHFYRLGDESLELLFDIFLELYEYGVQNHSDEPLFCWIFGFILSLHGYLFFDDVSNLNDLINRAVLLAPNDPLIFLTWWGNRGSRAVQVSDTKLLKMAQAANQELYRLENQGQIGDYLDALIRGKIKRISSEAPQH